MELKNSKLIISGILILVVIISLMIAFNGDCNSGFSEVTKAEVFIIHAKWCGHCRAAMSEFKKAVDKSKSKIKLIDSDSTDPSDLEIIKKYKPNSFPTITDSNNKKYEGKRKAEDILSFYNIK